VEGGESGPGPRILASGTELFTESSHLMGWKFTPDGMRLVLSREVTDLVARRLRPVVEGFLRGAGLGVTDVAHWILHPGGRRILEAYRTGFGLGDLELEWTLRSLERVGNLSSASVLFTLGDLWESGRARPGDRALLAALGPGFSAEMLVLEW
ncbi:MAG TPA: 3-oxoacyl-[acyl-carrier-protein] synthase III C-terminal domain-containing protein, partial [Planctomycetota bacterium]|nr:3-oxoacyl-[acyl-carrier-protein] synthase III C-terminal domain-containing protein [Planctomycetota bacterium]